MTTHCFHGNDVGGIVEEVDIDEIKDAEEGIQKSAGDATQGD